MKNVIELGNKEYEYEVNFKLSYNFLKYRNRISNGLDLSKADNETKVEIMNVFEKYGDKVQEMSEIELVKELSPNAISFLQEAMRLDVNMFNEEEIIDIISELTGEIQKEKIYEILDIEVSENGYDNLISKLATAVSEVFTNAKDNSQQEKTQN